jgi:hypothetical protein
MRLAIGRESFMNHQDEEISDVVVVLECKTTEEIDGTIAKLKIEGMTIAEIDYENSVVEGNIQADCVMKLQSVPHVQHVRSVFSYTAEFRARDPGNNDAPDADADDDAE